MRKNACPKHTKGVEKSARNTQLQAATNPPKGSKFSTISFGSRSQRESSLKGCFREKVGKKTSGSQTKQQETTSFLTVIAYIFFSDFLTLTAHANVAKYPFYSLKKRIQTCPPPLFSRKGSKRPRRCPREAARCVIDFFFSPSFVFFILFHLVLFRGYFLRLNARGFLGFARGRCGCMRGLTSFLRGGRWEGGNALNSRECARSRVAALAFRISHAYPLIFYLEECSTDFSCF